MGHGFGLCRCGSALAVRLPVPPGVLRRAAAPWAWGQEGLGRGAGKPPGNLGGFGAGFPGGVPATGTQCPSPLSCLPAPHAFAGAVPDHSLGVPLGWESGRERRRQTPEGGLRRQAGQRPRREGAQWPHAVAGGCAVAVSLMCVLYSGELVTRRRSGRGWGVLATGLGVLRWSCSSKWRNWLEMPDRRSRPAA